MWGILRVRLRESVTHPSMACSSCRCLVVKGANHVCCELRHLRLCGVYYVRAYEKVLPILSWHTLAVGAWWCRGHTTSAARSDTTHWLTLAHVVILFSLQICHYVKTCTSPYHPFIKHGAGCVSRIMQALKVKPRMFTRGRKCVRTLSVRAEDREQRHPNGVTCL
jgi:hypothetical protein